MHQFDRHIDPLEPRRLLAGDFAWVSAFGDRKTFDSAEAVGLDSLGNVYVAGTFYGKIDVNPGKKRLFLNSPDGNDAFVVKYSPAGKPLWARRFGSEGDDTLTHLAVGPDGSVAVAGTFDEKGVLTTPGRSISLDFKGRLDATVIKLDSAGGLLWAGTVGGEKDDSVTSLAVGPDGDVYWGGFVRLDADINPGVPDQRYVTRGVDDSFIQRLDGDNGSLRWSRTFGDANTHEEPLALAVNNAGQVFAAGYFNESVDFGRKGAKAQVRKSAGHYDIYLARLSASNGALQFVKSFGSKDQDSVSDLHLAPNGDVLVAGNFSDTADFNPAAARATLSPVSNSDAYIARYTAAGAFVWARHVGGDDGEVLAESLATDSLGNVYLTGAFSEEVDFNPRRPLFIVDAEKDGAGRLPELREATDAFVLRLDGTGDFDFVIPFAGEEGSARGLDIAVNALGDMYIAGKYADFVDFDPGPGAAIRRTREDRRDSDAFLLKLLA